MTCIEEWLREHLTEKRQRHTRGVVKTAVELARRYGADAAKAEQAALFHDMFRSESVETLNRYVTELELDPRYLNDVNLSHGKIAAAVMARDWGITDRDVINAVKYHTTGRAGMSLLEQIIYLADAIEPGRDYPGVDRLRKLAEQSLNQACLFSFENTIRHVRQKGNALHEDTIKARDALK